MSQNRAFTTDRQLSFRMFVVGFLLTLLFVAFGIILFEIGIQLYFIVVIMLAFLIAQIYFSDKLALWSMGGRVVEENEEPRLHAIVNRLVALADMPKPKVAVADIDIPNAFATGRSQKASVVCATRGLMRRLNDQELEAVLAHELSHVAHRDVVVITVASFLSMVAGLLTRIAFYAGMFGGFGSGDREDNVNSGLVDLIIILVSSVVYVISYLLVLALSRYRELAADRSGAILIGQPSLLKSALLKITGAMGAIPTRDLRTVSHYNAFFFAPALNANSILSNVFSTHPSLEVRIKKLDELERQMAK
jgi:heat shock protein HtpX